MTAILSPVRVFISYSHDDDEHNNKVLNLSNNLRKDGIDSHIDQYESFPKQGWPLWMEKQIELAAYVLIVCTEKYKVRAETDNPIEGLGATWESKIIRQCLYNAGGINSKFIPIILSKSTPSNIPLILQSYSYFKAETETGYISLYKYLTNQEGVLKVPLGKLKSLPHIKEKLDFKNYIWNVPYPRNSFFTGRNEVLEKIKSELAASNTTALIQPISGLGGIGKTQTALEYAYQYRQYYKVVFWVVADTETNLNTAYIEIAKLLKLEEAAEFDQNVIVSAVKQWFELNDQWLLILDNADEPSLLKKYIPISTKGQTLITSRAQLFDIIGVSKRLQLDVMTSNEALDFLKLRTGRLMIGDEETYSAELLANKLGYLPLALEQAAAFIHSNQIKFSDYLISFNKRSLHLLESSTPVTGEYPKSVKTTWALNFQKIQEKSLPAEDLLYISSFLSPDNIPIELLVKGASELGENLSNALTDANDDPVVINTLLAPLTEYSLIRKDIDSNSYNIHRLVQEVIKSTLDQESKRKWALKVCRALNKVFPSGSYSTWLLCEKLLPHAIFAARLTEEMSFQFSDSGEFINGVACYLRMRSDFKDSERLHLQSLSMRERDLGTDDLEVATCVNNLAIVYIDQLNFPPAEPLLIRALEIRRKVYGQDNPKLAFDFNQLGILYVKWGRFDKAKPLLESALQLIVDSPEYKDFFYAIILNNISELYLGLGNYPLAEKFCREGLAIREEINNPEKTWRSYNTLATILLKNNDTQTAKYYFEIALSTAEKVFGKLHPELLLLLSRYIEYTIIVGNAMLENELRTQLHAIKDKYSIK